MELKNLLIREARAKGLCNDGYKNMRECDIAALVKYYTIHPDWCMEREYPSFDMLKERFSNCEDMGVFVDKTFSGETFNERQAYIFHRCRGTVRVSLNINKAIIPMLYFGNECDITIEGVNVGENRMPTIIPLYIFGENIIATKEAPFVVFRQYDHELLNKSPKN